MAAQDWDAQYAAGNWDFLSRLSELPRYSVLAGYVAYLGRGGAVLDVGCGQGILLGHLAGSAYSRYVGVDLSAGAIATARKQHGGRATFLATDCEHYRPDGRFAVIVFNEVLYYLRDPLHLTHLYARSLESGGVLLVSMCTAAEGSGAILRQLKAQFTTVAETLVRDAETRLSWTCAAFRPR